MQSPKQRYQNDLKKQGFAADMAQASAVGDFEYLFKAMLVRDQQSLMSSSKKLFKRLFYTTIPAPKGLYLWGGVGRGKTLFDGQFLRELAL